MSKEIINFIEQIEGQLMMDLAQGKQSSLASIAHDLIARHKTSSRDICQAYEVVKHDLLG